jgi:C4-type Zn-finger protein
MKDNSKLTENQKDAYIAKDGKYCPYCGGEHNLHFIEEFEYPTEIVHEIKCKSCGKQWSDIYVLNEIRENVDG